MPDPETAAVGLLSELVGIDSVNPGLVAGAAGERRIVYQWFSLLTANPEVLGHPLVGRLAARAGVMPPQIVFRFALAVGMLPLTGTSRAEHMQQDLASRDVSLSADEVRAIESLSG